MKLLHGIRAILLLGLLLIGNLIDGAAHAGGAGCVGLHCHDPISGHIERHVHDLGEQVPAGSQGDEAMYNCCDQMLCQAAVLNNFQAPVQPLGLQTVSWGQTGQLVAVNRPRTLERPPNS